MDIATIKHRKSEIIAEQRAMIDKAESENRYFSDAEEKLYKKLNDEFDDLTAQLQNTGTDKMTSLVVDRQNNNPVEIRNNKSTIGVYRKMENNNNYIYDEKGTSLRDAFNRYLQMGPNAITPVEFRALQSDLDPSGGYLIAPVQVANSIISDLNNEVFIRNLAKKFTVANAQSLGCPAIDDDFGDPTFTAELGTGSEDSDLDFGTRDLYPHPAARRIRVSNKLLRASSLNPEQIVQQRMVYKMSVVHENAFLNGTGVNQPLGVFVASDAGIDAGRDVSTGNTATTVTVDGLINAVGELKAQYRKNAQWCVSRSFMTQVSKLKDGSGRFLLEPSITKGQPDMLLGFAVNVSEYCPDTFTANQYVAILGDWSFYYIVDALDMQIQRLVELYSETNQTGFIIRTEVDGMPVLKSAFVRVQLGS
jgi:HK97 family phage major capsid protein